VTAPTPTRALPQLLRMRRRRDIFDRETNQWNDASGLSFTLYRAYDPDLARWLSEDKLGPWRPGGVNPFVYVTNRPAVLSDPIGLDGLPPSNSPKTSLPPPPTPPGCTKVGLAFVCSPPQPPPPPTMCAEPPRRCTPYVDKGLYWACILFRAGSFTTWGPIPPGGPLGSAAGQLTTSSFNAAGQVLSVTNARNETTTYVYDTEGRVSTVTAPMTGATTTMTYDVMAAVAP
jgi:RHS repeat-associated protein